MLVKRVSLSVSSNTQKNQKTSIEKPTLDKELFQNELLDDERNYYSQY